MGGDGQDMATDWPPSLDDDWRVLPSGARVHRLAYVAEWVTLGAGVVVHPFAVVGHLASQSKALVHPGKPMRFLDIEENVEIGPHAVLYGGIRKIGRGSLIGDGASIREDVWIGAGCIIGRHVTVNFNARIGVTVRIMDGSFVSEGAEIGDGTLLGAGVVMSGDRHPDLQGRIYAGSNSPRIGCCCLIGSGANLLPGVKIGDHATIGAGALVGKDVPPGATVLGTLATMRPMFRPPEPVCGPRVEYRV